MGDEETPQQTVTQAARAMSTPSGLPQIAPAIVSAQAQAAANTQQFDNYEMRSGDSIKTISSQAVMGLERIVYDLRNASSLTSIASNSLTFIDQSGTSYTYSVSNGLLQRGSYTLLNSAQSITFTYLDSSGNSTNVASATKHVKITLNMQSNNVSLAYATLVGLRGMN